MDQIIGLVLEMKENIVDSIDKVDPQHFVPLQQYFKTFFPKGC